MKKRLLIILLIVAIYLATVVQAAGCGSTSCANTVNIEKNTDVTCSPSDVDEYYYSFYLNSEQEVEISLSSQPKYQVRLGLGKESECSQLTGNWAKWGAWSGTLDAGRWTILVEPNEAARRFSGTDSFTLRINADKTEPEKEQDSTPPPAPASKKSNGESCNSNNECLSDKCSNPETNSQTNGICCNRWAYGCCRKTNDCQDSESMVCEDSTCMLKNGNGCTRNKACLSGNCENSVCCQAGKTCCARVDDCGSGHVCDYSLMYCVKEDTPSTTIVESSPATKKPEGGSGVKDIKCYAEDKTDGTIGAIGAYPNCAFDDSLNGNNKVDGIWEGSYTVSGDELCLKANNLRALTEPWHTLRIGFTVTLSENTFSDGSTKKNIIVKEYTGNPGGIDAEKCVSIILKGAITQKSDGELCYSDNECNSGNCNKAGITNEIKSLEELGGGTCCLSGKNCCDKIGSITGSSRGKELCGDNHYLVPIKEEVKKEKVYEVIAEEEPAKEEEVKKEPTPRIEWIAPWVQSTAQENNPEAKRIKETIQNEIYPFIVHKFNFFRSDQYGRRNVDPNINLAMTSEGNEASWDEETNTLTVPYAENYEETGNFKKEVMQQNAIAHELIHYHFNGLAYKAKSGKYEKSPIWFREGLAEYGAHLYYKHKFSGKDGNPIMSVSEFREDRFGAYLENKDYNYKETWIKNGIDKASWESYDDFDTGLEDYDHIYYGAVFSFIKYFVDTHSNDEEMSDHLAAIFYDSTRVDLKFYKDLGGGEFYEEKELKRAWMKTFEKEYSVNKLDNEPTGFLYKIEKFFRNIFG